MSIPSTSDLKGKIVWSRSFPQALIKFSLIFILVFVFFEIIRIQTTVTLIVLFLITFAFFIGFLERKPIKITIDMDANLFKVEFRRLLVIKNEETYNLGRVKALFHYVTGARGSKLRELKIDYDSDHILTLRINQDGWSKEKVESIFSALKG